MSLINKMLQDLEARDPATNKPAAKSPYEDLRPVHHSREGSSSARIVLLLSLFATAIAAAGFYFFDLATLLAPPPAVPPRAPPVAPAHAPETPVTEKAPAATPPSVVESAPERKPEAKHKPARVPPALGEKKSAAVTKALPQEAARTPKPTPAKPVVVPYSADQQPPPSGKVVMEKRDRPLTREEEAEAHYRQAAQLVSQGRADDARAVLAAALASSPAHRQARELAAGLALQNGHLHEAQDLLAQGLRLVPDHVPFALLLARINIEQGAEGQAVATLESVRAAGAKSADFLSLLAALYQRGGRHADAVKAYRETVSLRAQDGRAWLGLAISLEATQDANAAAEAYNKVVQLGGLDPKLVQYAQQRIAALKK